jgi:HEPN domain-containing protein
MLKSDFETLAIVRLEDARLLLEQRRYSSAYYLAGYALEFALKACIAKQFRQHDIPDKRFVLATYTHSLADLVKQAGLQQALGRRKDESSIFAANWATVAEWDEQSRYQVWTADNAEYLLSAVDDPQDGVLPWIRTYW